MQLQLQGPLTAISDAISQLHAQIRQADEDAQQERQTHGASDPSAASPDDVLMLNVGGSEWRVKRQHMTQGEGVEGTLLAALFSGCWDGRLVRDDKQRVFIDICPEAFKTIHTAILNAATLRQAGKAASAVTLLEDASQRDYTGRHGFWTELLLSPLDKAASAAPPSGVTEPRLSATDSPAAMGDAVKTLEAIMKSFTKEKARLEGLLQAAQGRRDNLDKEIQAVSPFLLPLSGGDAIRSVDVCGQVISTTQSTLDEMGDELRNRFDMWPRPVEVVQPDHIGRMVDHYRRKRLGASAADMAAVLKMANSTEQAAFDVNTAMYSVKTDKVISDTSGDEFTQMPSGVRFRVVRPGSGPKPTRDQRVKVDYIEWRDDFDGRDEICDLRGQVFPVSVGVEWFPETVTDMRVGEVRRVILPARFSYDRMKALFGEYRLVEIL
ncbi:unnamed protein product [Vitrella brassicaformis CCMP3155]|uniref:Uncharacterized protein n=1 Tax=Vitrella brassicaformis (strain CCMP3155) TaxID=1169540 RepID=A0A0G4F301_VITBC|nr:unnamed protein product [Vitrella brassicaformis CCMP3155]|eukprot:CEM05775.1 unnamed protein product [Vitrella brassicaformis CCMP3155]